MVDRHIDESYCNGGLIRTSMFVHNGQWFGPKRQLLSIGVGSSSLTTCAMSAAGGPQEQIGSYERMGPSESVVAT